MKEPTLIILAAGLGSRFGGPKQIMPIDDYGHAIIDFSLYDAYRAGFRKVVFLIKQDIEADFKERIGRRMEKYFDVKYVFQSLDMLPEGYSIPEGRIKPWGTGHAVLCCKDVVDGPFAVINADDFYGPSAYKALFDFLSAERPDNEHAMVAYKLKNTVTEHGYVSRGICTVKDGLLSDVVERTKIEKRGEDAAYTEDGQTFTEVSGESLVSMNFWGFGRSMLDELENRFPATLDTILVTRPTKGEFYLPFAANEAIKENRCTVQVLDCNETWYGITYKEDMPSVVDAIKTMHDSGIYPNFMLD